MSDEKKQPPKRKAGHPPGARRIRPRPAPASGDVPAVGPIPPRPPRTTGGDPLSEPPSFRFVVADGANDVGGGAPSNPPRQTRATMAGQMAAMWDEQARPLRGEAPMPRPENAERRNEAWRAAQAQRAAAGLPPGAEVFLPASGGYSRPEPPDAGGYDYYDDEDLMNLEDPAVYESSSSSGDSTRTSEREARGGLQGGARDPPGRAYWMLPPGSPRPAGSDIFNHDDYQRTVTRALIEQKAPDGGWPSPNARMDPRVFSAASIENIADVFDAHAWEVHAETAARSLFRRTGDQTYSFERWQGPIGRQPTQAHTVRRFGDLSDAQVEYGLAVLSNRMDGGPRERNVNAVALAMRRLYARAMNTVWNTVLELERAGIRYNGGHRSVFEMAEQLGERLAVDWVQQSNIDPARARQAGRRLALWYFDSRTSTAMTRAVAQLRAEGLSVPAPAGRVVAPSPVGPAGPTSSAARRLELEFGSPAAPGPAAPSAAASPAPSGAPSSGPSPGPSPMGPPPPRPPFGTPDDSPMQRPGQAYGGTPVGPGAAGAANGPAAPPASGAAAGETPRGPDDKGGALGGGKAAQSLESRLAAEELAQLWRIPAGLPAAPDNPHAGVQDYDYRIVRFGQRAPVRPPRRPMEDYPDPFEGKRGAPPSVSRPPSPLNPENWFADRKYASSHPGTPRSAAGESAFEDNRSLHISGSDSDADRGMLPAGPRLDDRGNPVMPERPPPPPPRPAGPPAAVNGPPPAPAVGGGVAAAPRGENQVAAVVAAANGGGGAPVGGGQGGIGQLAAAAGGMIGQIGGMVGMALSSQAIMGANMLFMAGVTAYSLATSIQDRRIAGQLQQNLRQMYADYMDRLGTRSGSAEDTSARVRDLGRLVSSQIDYEGGARLNAESAKAIQQANEEIREQMAGRLAFGLPSVAAAAEQWRNQSDGPGLDAVMKPLERSREAFTDLQRAQLEALNRGFEPRGAPEMLLNLRDPTAFDRLMAAAAPKRLDPSRRETFEEEFTRKLPWYERDQLGLPRRIMTDPAANLLWDQHLAEKRPFAERLRLNNPSAEAVYRRGVPARPAPRVNDNTALEYRLQQEFYERGDPGGQASIPVHGRWKPGEPGHHPEDQPAYAGQQQWRWGHDMSNEYAPSVAAGLERPHKDGLFALVDRRASALRTVADGDFLDANPYSSVGNALAYRQAERVVGRPGVTREEHDEIQYGHPVSAENAAVHAARQGPVVVGSVNAGFRTPAHDAGTGAADAIGAQTADTRRKRRFRVSKLTRALMLMAQKAEFVYASQFPNASHPLEGASIHRLLTSPSLPAVWRSILANFAQYTDQHNGLLPRKDTPAWKTLLRIYNQFRQTANPLHLPDLDPGAVYPRGLEPRARMANAAPEVRAARETPEEDDQRLIKNFGRTARQLEDVAPGATKQQVTE